MNKAIAALMIGSTLVAGMPAAALARGHGHGRGHAAASHGGYRVGGYYPRYNNSRYWVRDYRAYRLPAPRHGYRYYRDDNGDIVMAAIASGLIGLVIGSSLDNGPHYSYGPPAYAYPPPPPRPYYYGYPPPRPYYGC
jgi:hypothetical protein